jgi:flagellar motor switch protein FliN
MTERSTTGPDLIAAAEAAALVLAKAFGLGDEVRSGEEWPIDDGDSVLRAVLGGDSEGELVLAVNDEVADRLMADVTQVAAAFEGARQRLEEALAMQLTIGEVERAQGDRPLLVIEILDDGQLTSVVGVTLLVAAVSAAQDFEPQSFDTPNVSGAPSMASPLSILNDVELTVTAELGRTTMQVRDLLELTPGMVVEIDRAAGAPIDLLVNGRRIASGEVVVIDEEFGIRITEILPTSERPR